MPARRALLVFPVLVAFVLVVASVRDGGARPRDPAHCQHVPDVAVWPSVLPPEDAPATEVTPDEARRVVAAFRKTWEKQVVPRADAVARTVAGCMRTDRDYYVRRVSGAAAARRLAEQADVAQLLWGKPGPLAQHEWVWEVYFGGWTDRFPPGGTFGGFLSAKPATLVVVHWPEG